MAKLITREKDGSSSQKNRAFILPVTPMILTDTLTNSATIFLRYATVQYITPPIWMPLLIKRISNLTSLL